MNEPLSDQDKVAIAEILSRRANEIATYSGENRGKFPGSVDLALDREMRRLRNLAHKLAPPVVEED